MYRTLRSLAFTPLAAALGCSAGLGDRPIHDGTGAPLIVRLQLRDGHLDVTGTGGDGVRYSFESDAADSFAYLTIEELDLVAPELAQLARSASARGLGATSDTYLDASAGLLGIR